jgi:hypothetical protein
MSHREFTDEDGRTWEVWDVHPSGLESSGSGGLSREVIDLESTVRRLLRLNLPNELREGWLAFRSDEESRRLAPIPSSWVALEDSDLAMLVRTAKPIVRSTPRL